MQKLIKCKLKECLNSEPDGTCDNTIPIIVPKLIPNKTDCPYYEDNFKKSWKECKAKGGFRTAFTGKRSDLDLEQIKKEKRKIRSDKGKKKDKVPSKKGKKKKEESSLKDLL